MAKRKSGTGRGISNHHHPTANRSFLLPRVRPVLLVRQPTYQPSRLLQNALTDRRLYHPNKFVRPVAATRRAHTQLVPVDRTGKSVRNQVAFKVPQKVALCVRRKQRREIMHAMGKAGRRGQRPPHRNEWSNVKC